jgi:hypothetical protein
MEDLVVVIVIGVVVVARTSSWHPSVIESLVGQSICRMIPLTINPPETNSDTLPLFQLTYGLLNLFDEVAMREGLTVSFTPSFVDPTPDVFTESFRNIIAVCLYYQCVSTANVVGQVAAREDRAKSLSYGLELGS